MKTLVSRWQGRELVELSAEGPPVGSAADQAQALFNRFELELRNLGLSLDNTIRSRLWGRDRASRDDGSRQRVASLAGPARSASSSYISPSHFESSSNIALDLWALQPSGPATRKQLAEYDPPIVPLRYLTWEDLVVLSGVTAVLPTLDDQVADILPRIEQSLKLADYSWERVVKMSCFLHRSQPLASLQDLLARSIG